MSTKPHPWTVELCTDDSGSCAYASFIGSLDDVTFAALDAAVEHVLTRNGMELCKTEWMKPLGKGLHEFRIRHDAVEITARFAGEKSAVTPKHLPILLRVFCHFYGDKVILLLSGYDKGADPSGRRQQREIALARGQLTAWQEQRRRSSARAKRGR